MTEVADIAKLIDVVADKGEERRKIVLRDEHLALARIIYEPGEGNEFHWHDGTSQALFVVEGEFTVRTLHPDGSITEKNMEKGQCALVGDRERESFVNNGKTRAVIYQVLRPGVKVMRD